VLQSSENIIISSIIPRDLAWDSACDYSPYLQSEPDRATGAPNTEILPVQSLPSGIEDWPVGFITSKIH